MDAEAKHPCVVIDKYGNPWGPFESPRQAAIWGANKWPKQEQDVEWHVAAMKQPNDE